MNLLLGRVTYMLNGDVISSEYRIVGHLGVGGMGEVYLAEDKGLYGRVVIKCPLLSTPISSNDFSVRCGLSVG